MSLLVLNSIPTNKQKKESSPKVTAKNGGYNPPKWTYTLNELYWKMQKCYFFEAENLKKKKKSCIFAKDFDKGGLGTGFSG